MKQLTVEEYIDKQKKSEKDREKIAQILLGIFKIAADLDKEAQAHKDPAIRGAQRMVALKLHTALAKLPDL